MHLNIQSTKIKKKVKGGNFMVELIYNKLISEQYKEYI